MNNTALATTNGNGAITSATEQVLITGDLKSLTPEQRVEYYTALCNSLGLNPLTKPFEYITLNGKLTLYARKDCTDQLRSLRGVSVRITDRQTIGDIHIVTAQATDKNGRIDESTGAVNIKGLAGENLANAYMKAESKSKRRVTLSIVGLGWIEESEVASITEAETVTVDHSTGEIVGAQRYEEPKRIDPPASKPELPPRPWSAEDAAAGIMKAAEVFSRKMGDGISTADDHKRLAIACSNLGLGNDARSKIIRYVFDTDSAMDLASCEVAAVVHWIGATKDETGSFVPNADSVDEARAIIAAHDAEIGTVIGDGLDAMGQEIETLGDVAKEGA